MKKNVVLIPSAWNYKVLGDVINFRDFYKKEFTVIIISDLYEQEVVEIENVLYIRNGCNLAYYYIFTTEYIIDAGTLNRHSKVYEKQQRVSVWHGIPYKKMFIDYDINNLYTALNYQNCYDKMISSSRVYSDSFLRNSLCYDGEILELGSSRADSLFLEDKKKNEIRDSLNIGKKKLILYAPTYRERGKYELPFNVKKILAILGDDYVFAVKLHYLNTLKPKQKVIDLTDVSNLNEILSITEILITDYSSLMFDYAVVGKKILLYQYDFEEYSSERGFMFNISDYIEKKYIAYKEDDLLEALKVINEQDLKSFKNTFYPYEIGKSTAKIISNLNFVAESRKKSEIIFLVNDLNQIGGVHSFMLDLGVQLKAQYNCKLIVLAINEFNNDNDEYYIFDKNNLFDIKLSKEYHKGAVAGILSGTNGTIISLQFSAHMSMQNSLKDKNCILMFHGDTKDIISRTLYKWHLDALNNKDIYNYKSLVFLTKTNAELISGYLNTEIKEKVTYIENSYDFKNCFSYKKDGSFVAITRLAEDKNIFSYIELFTNKYIDQSFILEIYGDGPLKSDFEKEIKKYGLSEKIILRGYEENKDIMFKDKRGLVSTSISEGFPLVLLEAFDHCIPVYSLNKVTSIYDLINSKVGILSNNIDEMAKSLGELPLYDKRNFRNHTLKFSQELVLKKWTSLIELVEKEKCIETFRRKKKVSFPLKKYTKKSFYIKKYRNLGMEKKIKIRESISLVQEKKILRKMNSFPLVTVIIPFYNNEDVIEDAIKSVTLQKYKNIEILLINDGSIYNELPLLKKFPQVKYIYKDNEGLGKTRNLGMKLAKGKYIFFLDSDDKISIGSITFLVNYAELNDLPIVAGKCIRINNNDISKREVWFFHIFKETYINKKEERIRLLNDTICTNKLYRKNDLLNSGIKFESGLYEDKLFMSKIYKHFDEIGILNNHIYEWYIYGENTSITTSISIYNFMERLKRIEEIWNISNEKEKFLAYHFAINHDFKIYMNSYSDFTDHEKGILFKEMSGFLIKNKNYFYKKKITNIYNIEYTKAIFDNNEERFNFLGNINSLIIRKNKEKEKSYEKK